MKQLLVVAAGGAVGAVARYLVYVLAGQFLGTGFPFGTLIVNIVGSFIMGVLVEGMALAWTIGEQMRLFLAVGILGAFTTFSTFSLDVGLLYERGKIALIALYVSVSVIGSIGALFLGMYLMRRALAPAL
ncbi:MAG: fluoride efflux transporter CrcB [Kiloniellales bacterium]